MHRPLALTFALAATAFAEIGPPPLSRDDARRILEAQQWKSVQIVAVIEGVSVAKVASPSLGHVLAIAWREGKWADLQFDVYHDRELGWFTYERGDGRYRVWNRDGLREIRPPATGW